MSGARATVLTTFASNPLLSVGGFCWATTVPIPMPAASVSSQTTSRRYPCAFMCVLLSASFMEARGRACPLHPQRESELHLVQLCSGRLNQARPARDFGSDERRELFGRGARRLDGDCQQLLAHLGQVHHAIHLGTQLLDDLRRRPRRRDDSERADELVARQPRLCHRRQVRGGGGPSRTRGSQSPDPAAADVRE